MTQEGRFTKVSPAAVELHVTMSALEDNPIQITLAPDKEAERGLGPKAADLRDCLLLEDRGYVRKAHDLRGRRLRHLEGKLLSWEVLPSRSIDLAIEWVRERRRTTVASLEIGRVYRLRWQIELLFMECKSHANSHRFDMEKSEIAEGLISSGLIPLPAERPVARGVRPGFETGERSRPTRTRRADGLHRRDRRTGRRHAACALPASSSSACARVRNRPRRGIRSWRRDRDRSPRRRRFCRG